MATAAPTRDPLAIVGAACRLPSADGPGALWELLRGARDAIAEVPPDRWSAEEYFRPDPAPPGYTCSRWGGFLDDVAGFDSSFFRITPREAARIDPQQRLLLELAWHALEDACIPAASLAASRTAVVTGISSHDYFDLSTTSRGQIDQYTGSGTSVSVAAGRLAFNFGFEGPALAVDTACSSSLVAVHLAANLVGQGECDLALAGGVHLMLTPVLRLIESRLGAQSPTGRCRSFDAAADGIVSGEGAGLIVLERLADALANGHPIRALVLGSAVNQDGRSSGLTVPNGRAQEAVMRAALTRAGTAPSRVGYVEAHGSGTPIGDPIEAEALSAVYGSTRPSEEPLAIGSLKANIGHLGAAAGIAGLLKAMLALEHERIPAQLHCPSPTPAVEWEPSGLRVASEELPLAGAGGAPAAAVSSFGFSGTNAHVILEQAPVALAGRAGGGGRPHVVCLSARSEQALSAHVARVREHVASCRPALADVARTATLGRSHLEHRATFVARTPQELEAALKRFEESAAERAQESAGRFGTDSARRAPRVAFLCPGQGNQYGAMARDLLDRDRRFAAAIARCDRHLRGVLPRALADMLCAPEDDPDLRRTSIVQPMMVGLGYALSEYWRAAGIRPRWAVGHSAGELTAACVAGLLSLPAALSLAAARGRLMEALPQDGAMALVTCARAVLDDVLSRHRPDIVVAAFNGPRRWVISGPREALASCATELAGAGASLRPLASTVAGHSDAMRPIAAGLRAAAAGLGGGTPGAPDGDAPPCRFVSTLTGQVEDAAPTRPAYWAEEALAPVRFQESVDTLLAEGCEVLIELGPGASLVSMVATWVTDRVLVTSLKRGAPAEEHLLGSLSELYRHGVAVDWRAHADERGGRFTALPGYPFERSRCWLPASAPRFAAAAGAAGAPAAGAPAHPLLGSERSTVLAKPGQTLYEQAVSAAAPAYLADHNVGGQVVMPAAAYIEVLLAAARSRWGRGAIRLTDITFDRPLLLGEEPVTIQTLLEEVGADALRGRVFSAPAAEPSAWTAHCEARVARAGVGDPDSSGPAWAPLDPHDTDAGALAEHAARVAAGGLSLGPSFQAIRALRPDAEGGTVHVELPACAGGAEDYCLHPVLLDSALQGASPAFGEVADGHVYLPTRIETLTWSAPAGGELACRATRRAVAPAGEEAGAELVIDADLRGPSGAAVAVVAGVHMRSVPIPSLAAGRRGPAPQTYRVAWHPLPALAAGPAATGAEVLILAEPGREGERLAGALRARGCSVLTSPGGPPPDAIVLVGALGADGDEDVAVRAARTARGALAALGPVIEAGASRPPAIWLVTAGARAVVPGDRVEGIAHAPLWGLGHVLAREHPELRCRLVDLDPLDLEESLAAVAHDLVATLLDARDTAATREDRVAHRGGRRFAERVTRVSAGAGDPARLELDADGVYLVTGGLSGLGLATAEWLAGHGARHLALVARGQPGPDAARRIEALRSAGVDAQVHLGDVSDELRLEPILHQARRRGPLRGVVHAAGVVLDGVISRQPWAEFAAVLAPKVQGGWLLHRLTLGDPLDLFLLYSSAVVLLGPPGQAAHTAANAFLDALAHHRRACGRPALAVDWGGWDGIGSKSVHNPGERMAAAGMALIDPQTGFRALEQLIGSGATQAGVVPVDWTRFCARFGRSALYAELADDAATPAAGARPDLAAALLELPAARRREALAREVGATIAKGIGMPATAVIDRSTALSELGVDSLLAVELRNRLSAVVDRPLRSTLLFDFPTIDELTEFLGGVTLALWSGVQAPEPSPEAADLTALSGDELDRLIDSEVLAWDSRRGA